MDGSTVDVLGASAVVASVSVEDVVVPLVGVLMTEGAGCDVGSITTGLVVSAVPQAARSITRQSVRKRGCIDVAVPSRKLHTVIKETDRLLDTVRGYFLYSIAHPFCTIQGKMITMGITA